MTDADLSVPRMAEIRRRVSELMKMAARLEGSDPAGSGSPSAVARLRSELARLAATVHAPGPARTAAGTQRRTGSFPGPVPSATDYWFG